MTVLSFFFTGIRLNVFVYNLSLLTSSTANGDRGKRWRPGCRLSQWGGSVERRAGPRWASSSETGAKLRLQDARGPGRAKQLLSQDGGEVHRQFPVESSEHKVGGVSKTASQLIRSSLPHRRPP